MANTPRLAIRALSRDASPASSQMQAWYNITMGELDGLICGRCDGFDTNTPPTLVFGEVYKIGSSPTGAWASNADDIAIATYTAFDLSNEPTTLGWVFITPSEGLMLYDIDADKVRLLVDAATDAWEIVPRAGLTITALTDSTTGSAGGTLSAIGDTSGSDQSSGINDNFATLNAKLNALVSTLESAGYLA